jgi:hypothetical protein
VRESSPLWDDDRDLGSSQWDQHRTELAPETAKTDLWSIDTRGDPANVQFSRPNTHALPRYYLTGRMYDTSLSISASHTELPDY